MEIRWVEAFCAVAEERHFGRAAERLYMAQSPLSQIIRKLEDELDVKLFERTTRRVELTAAGESFLPRAYRVLDELRQAANAAKSAEGQLRGTVRIGFSGAHNHHTLPVLARAVRKVHPGVDLELVSGVRTFDGIEKVRQGLLDITFIGAPAVDSNVAEPLEARALIRSVMGAVVPVDHPLASRESLDVAELRDEPFVMTQLDGGSILTRIIQLQCLSAGFEPTVVQQVSDPYLVITLVAAGVGVTLASSEMVEILPAGAKWVPLTGEPVAFYHGFAWWPHNESPVLAAVLKLSEEVLPTPE